MVNIIVKVIVEGKFVNNEEVFVLIMFLGEIFEAVYVFVIVIIGEKILFCCFVLIEKIDV